MKVRCRSTLRWLLLFSKHLPELQSHHRCRGPFPHREFLNTRKRYRPSGSSCRNAVVASRAITKSIVLPPSETIKPLKAGKVPVPK